MSFRLQRINSLNLGIYKHSSAHPYWNIDAVAYKLQACRSWWIDLENVSTSLAETKQLFSPKEKALRIAHGTHLDVRLTRLTCSSALGRGRDATFHYTEVLAESWPAERPPEWRHGRLPMMGVIVNCSLLVPQRSTINVQLRFTAMATAIVDSALNLCAIFVQRASTT